MRRRWPARRPLHPPVPARPEIRCHSLRPCPVPPLPRTRRPLFGPRWRRVKRRRGGGADPEGGERRGHIGEARRRLRVLAAVEGGGSCRDVVTQLAAVTSALDRAGFAIISTAMRDCMVDPEGSADAEGLTPDDVEKLFLSLA